MIVRRTDTSVTISGITRQEADLLYAILQEKKFAIENLFGMAMPDKVKYMRTTFEAIYPEKSCTDNEIQKAIQVYDKKIVNEYVVVNDLLEAFNLKTEE